MDGTGELVRVLIARGDVPGLRPKHDELVDYGRVNEYNGAQCNVEWHATSSMHPRTASLGVLSRTEMYEQQSVYKNIPAPMFYTMLSPQWLPIQ